MIHEQWTSSLTTGSRRFREVWDGTGRSSHNPIYTCRVRMILKSWYITWEGVQRKGDWKTYRKKIKKYDTKERTPDSWLYYLGYAKNDYYIFYLQLSSQTINDCYLLFKIRLVLSPTLYKFIVWTYWARTQSCFGVQAKTGLYREYSILIQYLYIIYICTHTHINYNIACAQIELTIKNLYILCLNLAHLIIELYHCIPFLW